MAILSVIMGFLGAFSAEKAKKKYSSSYFFKLIMLDESQKKRDKMLPVSSPTAVRGSGMRPQTGLHVGLVLVMEDIH